MSVLIRKTTITQHVFVSLFALAILGGCESGKRQDPLVHPNSVESVQMPAVSSRHTYHGSTKTVTSTPVSYEEPPTLSYVDRPILDNIATSLEMANYVHAMSQAHLINLLGRSGPYTVFAVPNEPLERLAAQVPGGLFAPQNAGLLRRVMAYTVVPGNWSPARFAKVMARAKSSQVALKTLSGDLLTVRRDQAKGDLVLVNTTGRVVNLWLKGAPQSNGTLYFTQDILAPRD